ncbi:MAG: hypothetical protein VYE04_08370 [Pseudomonadota bacterium]|nr:hypothetical protein [Pseudomonadota bacterium]
MLTIRFGLAPTLLLWMITAIAQDDLSGKWMLRLDSDEPAPVFGELELVHTANGWVGYVEGGPAEVSVDGNNLELKIDSRDLAGFVFFRDLRGSLVAGELNGTYTTHGQAKTLPPGGSWTGVRKPDKKPRAEPRPFDISGIWQPGPGIDFRKYSMDLTDAGQEWLDGYLFHYDQPNVRCVSPGIIAMVAWGGYPMEVLETENRLTILYEVENSVRRIFMDGETPHKYMPPSAMGYSTGYWDGATLVIKTSLLSANVRDFRGEPTSDRAQMIERYTLSENGSALNLVVELHDPMYYRRPAVRRRQWVRNPEARIFPYECDPDSFFRQMYDEDKLDMYFKRWEKRL